jgi:hypothetical protein
MRLKHMTEDKWNARGAGRREQRTHQPTGGRGNQGGLRMGEMERDAVIGHGIASFTHERYMKCADGSQFLYCNGCGTIPIYNEKQNIYICPMCDGPVRFIGDNGSNLELLPPIKKSIVSFSKVEMPYAFKLLEQELGTYMNIGMRVLTNHDLQKINLPNITTMTEEEQAAALIAELPTRVCADTQVPDYVVQEEDEAVNLEDLEKMGAVPQVPPEEMPAPLAAAAAPAAPVAEPQGEDLELEEVEDLDIAEGPPLQLAAPTAQGPYLVVPLSQQQGPGTAVVPAPILAASPPPPAQLVTTSLPGAPAMIAVDTSNAALQAQGLRAAPPANRPVRTAMQNNGTRRIRFANESSSGPKGPAPPSANVRVNVIKQG